MARMPDIITAAAASDSKRFAFFTFTTSLLNKIIRVIQQNTVSKFFFIITNRKNIAIFFNIMCFFDKLHIGDLAK